MATSLIAFVCLVIVGTSFLSGLFGMAGGMVLIGVLLLAEIFSSGVWQFVF